MKAIIVILWVGTMINGVITDCSPSQNVCEFWLVVHETLTMQWTRNHFPVRVEAHNGKLYAYDDTKQNTEVRLLLTVKCESAFSKIDFSPVIF